jgi:hypothetical protein
MINRKKGGRKRHETCLLPQAALWTCGTNLSECLKQLHQAADWQEPFDK